MQSKATTVQQYLAELPPERREALEAVRAVLRANVDPQIEEGMQYGMIGYYVPHRVYPAGYHCDPRQPLPFAGLAAQKSHMSLYLMGLYGAASAERPEGGSDIEQWFRQAWTATGRKLDMGKACLRFKRVDDLALDVIAEFLRRVTVREYIGHYEASIRSRSAASGGKSAAKRAVKATPARKTAKSAKSAGPAARKKARR